MPSEEVPADVQCFLRENDVSYEQLEVLLLLRSRPVEAWEPEALATTLKLPEEGALEALEHLCQRGLLEQLSTPGRRSFRYCPGSADIAERIDRLAQEYDSNRLAVISLMNTNAVDRVRTRAMHLFADAFVLGRKKDGNG